MVLAVVPASGGASEESSGPSLAGRTALKLKDVLSGTAATFSNDCLN